MGTHRSDSILVVEDDAVIRDMLSWVLGREGLQVLAAANGEEALAVLAVRTPSIILTDMHMPQKNGLALAVEAKEQPACRDIPIVLLSAIPPSAQADAALFDAVLIKPVALASLIGCIRTLLAKAGSRAV